METEPAAPGQFSAEERFRMFRAVLHEQVYPMRHFDSPGRWATRSVSYTPAAWRLFGRRRFVREVRTAAAAELRLADYAAYDLAPLRALIGDDGPLLCRMLALQDAAEMELRMKGMEADLALLTRNVARGRLAPGAEGTFHYRIALYEWAFEVTIRKGTTGWIWNLMN